MNICKRTIIMAAGAAVLPFHCGPGAIRCFGYSAVVKDTGSFRAYRFALTPNQFIPGRHHQERRHWPGGRVLLVRVLRQHRTQRVHRAPVLLRAVLRRGRLAEAVLPVGTRFSPLLIIGC